MKRTRLKYKPKRNPVPQSEIKAILARSGGLCEVCGLKGSQLAHVQHRGIGGAQGERAKLINHRSNMFHSCLYHHDLIDRRIKESFTGEREQALEVIKRVLV